MAIQVPSAYVSQQADQLTVTLVRSGAAGHSRNLGPLTVDFSATEGSLPAGGATVNDDIVRATIHSRQRVGHLPAGVTTETVVVPINSGAPNPGLVPVQLSVTSSSRRVRGSDETVYLANSLDGRSTVDRRRAKGRGRNRRHIQQADGPCHSSRISTTMR